MELNRKKWTGLSTAAMLFTALVCLWTLSHNLDLFERTLTTRTRGIGIAGCFAAEIFALWSLHRFLTRAGESGRAALHAHLTMISVLFLNTVVASLKTEGSINGQHALFRLYAAYGVSIAFAAVIVGGLHHILRHDSQQREDDLRAGEAALDLEARLFAQARQQESLRANLTTAANVRLIDDDAAQRATRTLTQALRAPTVHGQTDIAPVSRVNGLAHPVEFEQSK